jgi:uncharacterized protein (UPF0335 family)
MENLPSLAQKELREYVRRLEKLEDEKKDIAEAIKEIMADVKGSGFDPKIVRQLIKIRKTPKAEYERSLALLETYLHAIGQLDGTPLGEAGRRQLEAVAL